MFLNNLNWCCIECTCCRICCSASARHHRAVL